MLLFYGAVSSKIGRVASKLQFRPTFLPAAKIRQLLCPIKDSIGSRIPGVYRFRVPWAFGRLILARLSDGWLREFGNSPGTFKSISQKNLGLQNVVFC